MSIRATIIQVLRIFFFLVMMLAMATGCARMRGGAPVVRGDRVDAVIVLPDEPSTTVREAAEILQDGIRQMTDRTVDIVYEWDVPARATVLALGPTGFAAALNNEASQDDFTGDSYVLRSRGRVVVIAGNDEDGREGTVYAVYDLLQRLGFGWYGPEPEWQVIPNVANLRIPELDVAERAAFDRRRLTATPAGELPGRAWRLSGSRERMQIHDVNALVPRILREEHPDWFSAGQPDLCHPDVIAHAAEELKTRMDDDAYVHVLKAAMTDLHVWPDSEYRRAVGNPAAQSLYFANQIADRLRPEYEGRFAIHFLAAGFTHAPPSPSMRAAPEVFVKFVNESNRTKPWDGSGLSEPDDFLKSQAWIRRHFKGWLATGADLGIQDGWLPGDASREWLDTPWFSMENTVRNARYWQRHGVREVEILADNGQYDRSFLRWPQLYLAARALWNPQIDPVETLRQACKNLYGPAAESMIAYFQLLEQALLETPYFHQNRNFPPAAKVYSPDIVAAAGEFLEAASVAAREHEEIAERIARESERWETATAIIAASREAPRRSYRAYVDGKFLYWPEPEATVGTIRRLFGIPAYVPLYEATSEGGNETDYGETAVRETETTQVIELNGTTRLTTGKP